MLYFSSFSSLVYFFSHMCTYQYSANYLRGSLCRFLDVYLLSITLICVPLLTPWSLWTLSSLSSDQKVYWALSAFFFFLIIFVVENITGVPFPLNHPPACIHSHPYSGLSPNDCLCPYMYISSLVNLSPSTLPSLWDLPVYSMLLCVPWPENSLKEESFLPLISHNHYPCYLLSSVLKSVV